MEFPAHASAERLVHGLVLRHARHSGKTGRYDVRGIVIPVAGKIGDRDLGIGKGGADHGFDLTGLHCHDEFAFRARTGAHCRYFLQPRYGPDAETRSDLAEVLAAGFDHLFFERGADRGVVDVEPCRGHVAQKLADDVLVTGFLKVGCLEFMIVLQISNVDST